MGVCVAAVHKNIHVFMLTRLVLFSYIVCNGGKRLLAFKAPCRRRIDIAFHSVTRPAVSSSGSRVYSAGLPARNNAEVGGVRFDWDGEEIVKERRALLRLSSEMRMILFF